MVIYELEVIGIPENIRYSARDPYGVCIYTRGFVVSHNENKDIEYKNYKLTIIDYDDYDLYRYLDEYEDPDYNIPVNIDEKDREYFTIEEVDKIPKLHAYQKSPLTLRLNTDDQKKPLKITLDNDNQNKCVIIRLNMNDQKKPITITLNMDDQKNYSNKTDVFDIDEYDCFV